MPNPILPESQLHIRYFLHEDGIDTDIDFIIRLVEMQKLDVENKSTMVVGQEQQVSLEDDELIKVSSHCVEESEVHPEQPALIKAEFGMLLLNLYLSLGFEIAIFSRKNVDTDNPKLCEEVGPLFCHYNLNQVTDLLPRL